MSLTAPQLFAMYRGLDDRTGPHRCYYCGGWCDGSYLARDLVKDSFTARDTVTGGEHVCWGCVAAMDERGRISLADGQQRDGQKLRCYSWVVAGGNAIAATKAHLAWLRGMCLAPPTPPFVICLSDSGQRHLLYRAAVCYDAANCTVTLEGERVSYRPVELADRLTLCKKLVAATGKPALAEPLSVSACMRVVAHHGDETLIGQWQECREQPLSRLAAWLCPAKEDCLHEYPEHGSESGSSSAAAANTRHKRLSAAPRLFD